MKTSESGKLVFFSLIFSWLAGALSAWTCTELSQNGALIFIINFLVLAVVLLVAFARRDN